MQVEIGDFVNSQVFLTIDKGLVSVTISETLPDEFMYEGEPIENFTGIEKVKKNDD
jgi:hypothetical protein